MNNMLSHIQASVESFLTTSGVPPQPPQPPPLPSPPPPPPEAQTPFLVQPPGSYLPQQLEKRGKPPTYTREHAVYHAFPYSPPGELIATWKFAARKEKSHHHNEHFAVVVFVLGTMRQADTFAHVSESQVGDVYMLTSGYPEPWSPLDCGGCLGGVSHRRTPEYLGTINNTVYLQLTSAPYNFKSVRYYPLAKLDLLHHLPVDLEHVLLVDTDALLTPWHNRIFRQSLAHATSSSSQAWLLSSRAGSRAKNSANLAPGYDGPQPGGALLRLRVLRDYQRKCSEANAYTWPSVARLHGGKTDVLKHWSWWRCVFVEASQSSQRDLKDMIKNQNTGMGEMRLYKMLHVVAPYTWMELPCQVHLDTQTLFHAANLDHDSKTKTASGTYPRACTVKSVFEVAVVHGASSASSGPERMHGIPWEFAKRLVYCAAHNRSSHAPCWEAARLPPAPPAPAKKAASAPWFSALTRTSSSTSRSRVVTGGGSIVSRRW